MYITYWVCFLLLCFINYYKFYFWVGDLYIYYGLSYYVLLWVLLLLLGAYISPIGCFSNFMFCYYCQVLLLWVFLYIHSPPVFLYQCHCHGRFPLSLPFLFNCFIDSFFFYFISLVHCFVNCQLLSIFIIFEEVNRFFIMGF